MNLGRGETRKGLKGGEMVEEKNIVDTVEPPGGTMLQYDSWKSPFKERAR